MNAWICSEVTTALCHHCTLVLTGLFTPSQLHLSINKSTRVVVIVFTTFLLLPPKLFSPPLTLSAFLSYASSLLHQLVSKRSGFSSLSLPPSIASLPPSLSRKWKPMRRVFQVFIGWEWWSRWTRWDTQGGSLVCFHCVISVHNKHINSRWTTPLPGHLGWELDCNKQPSPLYRTSTANDAFTEIHTKDIGFGFGNLQYCFWWVNRIT